MSKIKPIDYKWRERAIEVANDNQGYFKANTSINIATQFYHLGVNDFRRAAINQLKAMLIDSQEVLNEEREAITRSYLLGIVDCLEDVISRIESLPAPGKEDPFDELKDFPNKHFGKEEENG